MRGVLYTIQPLGRPRNNTLSECQIGRTFPSLGQFTRALNSMAIPLHRNLEAEYWPSRVHTAYVRNLCIRDLMGVPDGNISITIIDHQCSVSLPLPVLKNGPKLSDQRKTGCGPSAFLVQHRFALQDESVKITSCKDTFQSVSITHITLQGKISGSRLHGHAARQIRTIDGSSFPSHT